MTQSAAANTEQSAETSEKLNAQAEQMKAHIQELVKMVGGSANGSTFFRSALGGGKRSKGTSAAAHRALLPEKKGGSKAGLGRSVKAVPPPEEVIPMTDAEFKDFQGIACRFS